MELETFTWELLPTFQQEGQTGMAFNVWELIQLGKVLELFKRV